MRSAFVFSILFVASVSQGAPVLVVGDSHNVGPFGDALYKSLSEGLGQDVRSIGLAGASGTTYSSDKAALRTLRMGAVDRSSTSVKKDPHGSGVTVPKLSDLIAEEKPKVVVVELGDNFAGYNSSVPDSYVKAQVEQVLKQIEQKSPAPRCFWITPIWTDKEGAGAYKKTNARLYEVNKLIKEAAGNRCKVLDSTKDLGLDQKEIKVLNDGIHFGSESGKKWGKAAAAKIIESLNSGGTNIPAKAGTK